MKMFRRLLRLTGLAFALSANLTAATFSFTTDPFAGSTAPNTPGRQVVGGEDLITFNIASDVFAFTSGVFGVSAINFANNIVSNIPTTGVNTIVLRSFDNDSDSNTPFGAGNAANLIADRLTSPGSGFFIYFNSALDLPRLVYSADLNDNTSDLKILARLTNLSGQSGRDGLANFTAANFQILASPVPEPASFLTLLLAAGSLAFGRRIFSRRK